MNDSVVFDGKSFAKEREEKLLKILVRLPKKPKLVAILVGNNPESELYLKIKQKKAEKLGIGFEFKKFSDNQPKEIIDFINQKNADPEVNGIIVELPLPTGFQILDSISPSKDVDCLTTENLKLLAEGKPRFVPPTVKAVGEILGKRKGKIIVVGSKGAVGRGILDYLKNAEGVDRETKDLASITKTADILISATGVGHLIKKEMVKPGAVVIDVGIEKQSDGNLKGDVDFEKVRERTSFITPVPGGVGPITVICLMENLIGSVYH